MYMGKVVIKYNKVSESTSRYIEFGSNYTINNLRNFDTYVMKLISFGCNQYDRGSYFSLNFLDTIKALVFE